MRLEMLLWMARQYLALVAWCARRLGVQATSPATRARHRAKGRNWGGYRHRTRRIGPYSVSNVLFLASGPRDFSAWSTQDFKPVKAWLEEPVNAEPPSPRTYPRNRAGNTARAVRGGRRHGGAARRDHPYRELVG